MVKAKPNSEHAGMTAHSKIKSALAIALLAIVTGCVKAKLPDCVVGINTPSKSQLETWEKTFPVTQLDLGIDGSGSMLGLTGDDKAIFAWKSLIKSVTLSAASNGITVNPKRIGGGSAQTINSSLEASNPCFFQGCGAFAPVSSSLDSLWKTPGIKAKRPPLRLMISDLEVNDGDISNLLNSIKPHVNKGAVIGVLAIQLPFKGNVFNSQGQVIYNGNAQRPVFILATGPRNQLHDLLTDIKGKVIISGIPSDSVFISFLEDQANAPTVTAKSITGIPSKSIFSGAPVSFSDSRFSQPQENYQLARLTAPDNKSIKLSSLNVAYSGPLQPENGFVRLESIDLPGQGFSIQNFNIEGFQVENKQLTVQIKVPSETNAGIIRAFVPRGQLPDSWWLRLNRRNESSPQPQDKSDGLLLLLSSLGELMVEPGASPAAALCLAFNR